MRISSLHQDLNGVAISLIGTIELFVTIPVSSAFDHDIFVSVLLYECHVIIAEAG